jgi:hypothetical protein
MTDGPDSLSGKMSEGKTSEGKMSLIWLPGEGRLFERFFLFCAEQQRGYCRGFCLTLDVV